MLNVRQMLPEELDIAVSIDDDASTLFDTWGVRLTGFGSDHPFVVHEQARWRTAAHSACAFFAVAEDGEPVGFTALASLPCGAFVDQLSVRRRAMRQGIGTALLQHGIAWARTLEHEVLWLTTYGHLPWNRPYYERAGFSCVPEDECPPEIRAFLDEERGALPFPEHRVAMRIPL